MSFILKMDVAILQFIQTVIKNPILDFLMPLITRLGDMGLVWILIVIILIVTKKHRKVGWMVLVTLILGAILVDVIIKPIVARPRPFTDLKDFILLIKQPISYSFPSGHTTSSFGAATTIALNRRRYRVPAYALAALIAFSRMYLYVHYPTDIVVGCLIGVITGVIIKYIMEKRKK